MARNGKTHGRFARFFCLIKGREKYIDKDEMVLQFTEGRTSHLHEMTNVEFNEMCDVIEERFQQDKHSYKEKVRKARSAVLYRIAKLGINTVDNWDEVNAFLLSPKIAGKLLYEMDLAELKALVKKLVAIADKGGIKSIRAEEEAKARQDLTNMIISTPATTTNNQKFLS